MLNRKGRYQKSLLNLFSTFLGSVKTGPPEVLLISVYGAKKLGLFMTPLLQDYYISLTPCNNHFFPTPSDCILNSKQ